MIALTAYGVRKANKAYKKHKAEKDLQKGEAPIITDPSNELRVSQEGASPTRASSTSLTRSGTSTSNSTNTSSNRERDSQYLSENKLLQRNSRYTDSVYSENSTSSPVVDFRQYQQYIERQSHGYLEGLDAPPSYDVATSTYPPPHPSAGNVYPQPTAPGMIIGASNYITHQAAQPYGRPQQPVSQGYPQQTYQPQTPNSVVSEMPERESYRTRQGYPAGTNSEPMSAISELAADTPSPLRHRQNPGLQELPGISEIPVELPSTTEDEQVAAQRQMRLNSLKRARGESRSDASDDDAEGDVEHQQAYADDLAKTRYGA